MPDNKRWLVSTMALAILLGLTYQILHRFLPAMLWAIVLGYVTWPVYLRVHRLLQERAGWAALVMTAGLSSLAILPLLWAAWALQRELVDFFRELPVWLAEKPVLPPFVLGIPLIGDALAHHLDRFDDVQSLITTRALPWLKGLSNNLMAVLQELGRNLAKLGFTLLTLFFVYRDGGHLVRDVRAILRLHLGPRGALYLATVESTTKAVVYGLVLTALGQGCVAGIGYLLVGLKAPILMTLVTVLFAMIPFGTPLVWGGCSLWLVLNGETTAAISLFAWGAFVVSWVDNVIRPMVISANTPIPFVWVLFGVLGGLINYGFIGLFAGPLVLAVALAVWREWVVDAVTAAQSGRD